MFTELYGYGSGAVDQDPPIKQDGDAGQRCRELALRVSMEVLADASLGQRLYPIFAAGREGDTHALLARLIMLLARLIEEELPRLRRAIRCEARTHTRWQAESTGGRLDALTSLRRSAGVIPTLWLVQRTERHSDSPVNRLVAAVLRQVATALEVVSVYVRTRRLRGMHRERSLFERAAYALAAFLWASPLASLAVDLPPIERLFKDARQRPAELQRVASFLNWWEEFRATDLRRLDQLPEGRPLSIDASYELVVALSLLLALRDQLTPLPGDGLRFRARWGEVTAQFGIVPLGLRRMRPATLVLELRANTGAKCQVFVEARNHTARAAGQVATYLELLVDKGGPRCRGLLFLPIPSEEDDLMRACPIKDLADDPIGFWAPILAEWACFLEEHS